MLLTWEHFIRFLWHGMIHCISMRTSQSAVLRWYRFSWANNENSFHRVFCTLHALWVSLMGNVQGGPRKRLLSYLHNGRTNVHDAGEITTPLCSERLYPRGHVFGTAVPICITFDVLHCCFFYLIAYCIVLNMYLVFTFTSCFIQSVATWWKATTY